MLDMKDQELNRAIGELMGYSMKNTNTTKVYYRLVDPTGQLIGKSCVYEPGVWSLYGPKYCTNPAASLEAQAAAIDKDDELYITHMNHVLWGTCINLQYKHAARITNATPRQRAEAAYMTLSSRLTSTKEEHQS